MGVRLPRRSRRLALCLGAGAGPEGKLLANYWQGEFPWQNLALDGFERTAPVGRFPPNGYGLLDMIGNAWEWTADWASARHEVSSPCCGAAVNPRGGSREASIDPTAAGVEIPRKVLKGGVVRPAPRLLPALPPRRPHAPPGRYRHQSHQLSLRRARVTG